MKVAGAHVTVVGAGRSGVAAANLLATRGADVLLVEQQPDKARPENLEMRVAYEAGTQRIRSGDLAVLSPGIPEVSPLRREAAECASEVIGEVELFFRLCPAPILAVTGTDGKSTTTTMLGAICAATGRPTFVGGNLGNPLCEGLDALTSEHIVVAEISCFQLTSCERFRPQVAVVTNIAEDHLDYHGGFEAYQRAKQRIFARMRQGDVAIINGDDPEISRWEIPSAPTLRRFTVNGPGDTMVRDGCLMVYLEGQWTALMRRDELPVAGDHNVQNALAAALAAASFGIELPLIAEALRAYQPLPHRLEALGKFGGVSWVNDSKATNPNAAAAGIRALASEQPLVVIAGGSSKDADFMGFSEVVREHTAAAVLYGETRFKLAEVLNSHPIVVVETLDDAVLEARRFAQAGGTVLLGPACASFDQFRSYAHRGEHFRALVSAMSAP